MRIVFFLVFSFTTLTAFALGLGVEVTIPVPTPPSVEIVIPPITLPIIWGDDGGWDDNDDEDDTPPDDEDDGGDDDTGEDDTDEEPSDDQDDEDDTDPGSDDTTDDVTGDGPGSDDSEDVEPETPEEEEDSTEEEVSTEEQKEAEDELDGIVDGLMDISPEDMIADLLTDTGAQYETVEEFVQTERYVFPTGYIGYLRDNGIIEADASYEANELLSRDEFLTMLFKAHGIESTSPELTALSLGITDVPVSFRWESAIQKIEALKFILKLRGEQLAEVEDDGFADVSMAWERKYTKRARDLGIVHGEDMPDGTTHFNPQRDITKGEAAKIIVLSVKLKK